MKNSVPEPEKINALSKFLDCHYQTAKKLLRNEDYEVLTEIEADKRWNKEFYYYIDEIILPEIPECYHFYFNEEGWLRDARINGCRGESISRYDGIEHDFNLNDEWFYIYRQN